MVALSCVTPSLNLTNCGERSSSSSSTSDTTTIDNSRSDNTETPLIIPAISPTSKVLDDAMTEGDLGITDTYASNDNDKIMTIPKIVWTKILILTEITVEIRAIAKAGPLTTNLH